MAKDLVKLKIRQIGYVPAGAAEEPRVLLVKARKEKESVMPKPEKKTTALVEARKARARKEAQREEAQPAEVEKGEHMAALEEWLQGQSEEVQAMIMAALQEVMEETEAEEEATDPAEAEEPAPAPAAAPMAKIAKLLPAKLRKEMEALQEVARRANERSIALEKREAQRVWLAKAEKLTIPKAKPERVANVLAEASDRLEPATFKDLEAMFADASEAVRTSEMFKTNGGTGNGGAGGDAKDRLRERAKEIAKEERIAFPIAYRKAVAESPELLREASPRPKR